MSRSAEGCVLSLWRRWGGTAIGRRLYSLILGHMVPYSGSIRPLVVHLEPGFSRVELRDRRGLRNHLHSIHAIALANAGELASGLAMLAALSDDVKAIVIRLEIDYLKKARGLLIATGRAEIPGVVTETVLQIVDAEITDQTGDVVARLRVHDQGGIVYHDVTERKWAQKAVDAGVDGLIAVNNRAGGHAGGLSAQQLMDELSDLNLPMICAGGIGDEAQFVAALRMGYAGCQLGTRFIATDECNAAAPYKEAIIDAQEDDIVLSERITGVPVSLIHTPDVAAMGLKAGPLARWLLRGNKSKHWMRMIYTLRSAFQLRTASLDEHGEHEFWQAGKSVSGIQRIEPVADIVYRFHQAWLTKLRGRIL